MTTEPRPVIGFMTPAAFSIDRTAPLSSAHALMRQHCVRHLPVLDGARLAGLLSMDDMHLLETLPAWARTIRQGKRRMIPPDELQRLAHEGIAAPRKKPRKAWVKRTTQPPDLATELARVAALRYGG